MEDLLSAEDGEKLDLGFISEYEHVFILFWKLSSIRILLGENKAGECAWCFWIHLYKFLCEVAGGGELNLSYRSVQDPMA